LALYFGQPGRTGPGSTQLPTATALPVATQTAAPTAPPAASTPAALASPRAFPDSRAKLPPGTYIAGAPFPLQVSLTIQDADWWTWTDGVGSDAFAAYRLSPDPPLGHGFVFDVPDRVYTDPCDSTAGFTDLDGTVEDFVSAMRAQPLGSSSEPVSVTIDGYSGQYVDLIRNQAGASCGTYNRWPSSKGSRQALVGEHDQLWVLDVDGVLLVIDVFSFQETTAEMLANVRQLVESVDIEPLPVATPTP